MQADTLGPFLLDANMLSLARSKRGDLPSFVRCPPAQFVVPLAALDECLATTSDTHPRRTEYLALVANLTTLDTGHPDLASAAAALVLRYERRGAAATDLLIAAAAI